MFIPLKTALCSLNKIIVAMALMPTGICLMGTDDHKREATFTCPGQKNSV